MHLQAYVEAALHSGFLIDSQFQELQNLHHKQIFSQHLQFFLRFQHNHEIVIKKKYQYRLL